MRVQIEGTEEELIEKADAVLRTVLDYVRPHHPRAAEVLEALEPPESVEGVVAHVRDADPVLAEIVLAGTEPFRQLTETALAEVLHRLHV